GNSVCRAVVVGLYLLLVCSSLIARPTLNSTLFPYTTLFRSFSIRIRSPPIGARFDACFTDSTIVEIACSVVASPRAPGCTRRGEDRKSTRLNSSHLGISYAVFCLKKKDNAG